MTDTVIFAVRFASAIGCGLMAGLFFTFSVCVMRALSRLPAAHGMAAMQSINATILNSVFLTTFLGTALLCLIVAGTSLWRWEEAGAMLFFVGAALYLLGAFLTTIVFNVPMNDGLAATAATDPAAAARWASYLTNWTAWNHVRTASALAAVIVLTLALCRTSVAPLETPITVSRFGPLVSYCRSDGSRGDDSSVSNSRHCFSRSDPARFRMYAATMSLPRL